MGHRDFTWPDDGRDHYPARPNPYYDPEACDLTIIAELTDPEASYSFSTILAFRDNETGGVYLVHDSGCSCPTPFEDIRGLSDMTQVRNAAEVDAFIDHIESSHYVNYRHGDTMRFRAKIVGTVR